MNQYVIQKFNQVKNSFVSFIYKRLRNTVTYLLTYLLAYRRK